MAVGPGIFVHGFAIKLHYRVFMISCIRMESKWLFKPFFSPGGLFSNTLSETRFALTAEDIFTWAKRNNAISCCAEGRDYSSSFLVKYIPKRSGENKENGGASLPVTQLETRHNGSELNLARVDLSKYSSREVLDVNSNNHGSSRASDLNNGLSLAVEEEIEGYSTDSDDELLEETENFVDDSSKAHSGIQPDHSRQAVEKLAIELLASILDLLEGCLMESILEKPVSMAALVDWLTPNFILYGLSPDDRVMRHIAKMVATCKKVDRAFTALELKKKLQAKRFPLDIVDAVITDFQSRGLINDCLYAETYSRSRWSSSSWGPRRIKLLLWPPIENVLREIISGFILEVSEVFLAIYYSSKAAMMALSKKGISEVDVQKAIKLVFESEEGGDHDSGIAMSKLSTDQLYVQASKQWQRSRGLPQDTRKSRMVRWLQYRGFNWSVTSYVLKKLEMENPS
ncbi:hypothetical protein OROMI_022768 [Orobanche minor]